MEAITRGNVRHLVGTLAEYLSKPEHDERALYFLSDVKEMWKGDTLYGTGAPATPLRAGLLSAEDKVKLDNLSRIGNLRAVDASVIVTSGDEDVGIRVRISAEEGNALRLNEDGLFASGNGTLPVYGIAKQVDEDKTTYRLTRASGDATENIGDEIVVPDTTLRWEEM